MDEEIDQVIRLLDSYRALIKSQQETISTLQTQLSQSETRIAELQAEAYSRKH